MVREIHMINPEYGSFNSVKESFEQRRLDIRGGLVKKYGLGFLEGLNPLPGQSEEWDEACKSTPTRDFILKLDQTIGDLGKIVERTENLINPHNT